MSDTVSRIIIEADGSIARREFASVGDAASNVGYEIKGGIGASLDAVSSSFARLDEKIASNSLRGLPMVITQSSVAVDNLRSDIDALRASGADVSQLEASLGRYERKLIEATTAAGRLKDKQEEVNRTVRAAADAADFGLGKFGSRAGSVLETLSKVFFIANATGQILTGLGRAIDSVQTATGTSTEGTREQTKELQALGQSIQSLDLVGFAEHLGQSVGLLIDGKDATNELAEANERWRQKIEGATGALVRAMQIQLEIEQGREKKIATLKDEEAAINRIAASELKNGEITKETSDRIADLLSRYEQMGVDPPERLKTLAAAHGILSDKAKESADAVAQLAGQLEGNAEALKKRDEELVKAIALIEKDGIVTKETAKSVSAALDEQLAGYAKLGTEPPKVVAELAAKYKDLAAAASDSAAGMSKVQEQLDTLRKSLDEALDRYNKVASADSSSVEAVSKLRAEISNIESKNLTSPEDTDRLDALKKKLFELTAATFSQSEASKKAEETDAAYLEVLKAREAVSQKETELLNEQLAASEKRRQEIAAASVAEGELTMTMENGTQAIAGRGIVITNLSEEARKGGVHFDELTRTLVNTEKPLELVAKAAGDTAGNLSDISAAGPAANETLEKAAGSISSMRTDMEWMKQNLPELASLIASTFNGAI